mmetsp:Transcript_46157/g.128632  ORF Transcript_46157/g.128632 Transcript_46157/m.128632 type:complete len:247 (-) Transcript_46157:148-888(-)
MAARAAAGRMWPQGACPKRLFHKTRMCKFSARGICSRGDQCSFAHRRDELRFVDLARTKLCVDFARSGACQAGSECKFAHGEEELRSVAGAPSEDAPPLGGDASLMVLRAQIQLLSEHIQRLCVVGMSEAGAVQQSQLPAIAAGGGPASDFKSDRDTASGFPSCSATSAQLDPGSAPAATRECPGSAGTRHESAEVGDVLWEPRFRLVVRRSFLEVVEEACEGSRRRTRSSPAYLAGHAPTDDSSA